MPNEKYLTLTEATKLTPRQPTVATLWRWARRGVLARNGTRIQLRHIRVGGRVYTTEQWLHEFFEAVMAADLSTLPWQHPNRAPLPQIHDAADARLREEGM